MKQIATFFLLLVIALSGLTSVYYLDKIDKQVQWEQKVLFNYIVVPMEQYRSLRQQQLQRQQQNGQHQRYPFFKNDGRYDIKRIAEDDRTSS